MKNTRNAKEAFSVETKREKLSWTTVKMIGLLKPEQAIGLIHEEQGGKSKRKRTEASTRIYTKLLAACYKVCRLPDHVH
jgi:hypothetical protein